MVKAVIIGAGARGQSYSEYALNNPSEMKVVAIAEPKKYIQKMMKERHHLDDSQIFDNYEELLAKGVLGDAVFVCTQDNQHVDPAIKAIKTGYKYLMVEKPIDTDIEKCKLLAKTAKENGAKVQVCHSLRYTPFYRKLKSIIESGEIGEVVNVNHLEAVGSFHMAHSFVRGDWRNSKQTSPMILAKCCHDMDLLIWLLGKNCVSISSFGSLTHFKPENAPEGSTDRCINGCKLMNTCPFSAMQYFGYYKNHLFREYAVEKEGFTDIVTAMKEGRYGRCVYRCDNDVVDHQVVTLLFEDGVTATHTMCGFSNAGRDTRIMGTKGEIYCNLGGTIKVTDFATRSTAEYNIQNTGALHGGADDVLVQDFIATIELDAETHTDIDFSVQSHIMAIAAEKARVEQRVVRIDEM